MDVRQYLESLLSKVAAEIKWNNYKICADIDNEKGNGFLGEFFLVTLVNKDTNENLELAIKKAFKNEERRNELSLQSSFVNEVHFYETIVPELFKFKNRRLVTESYDFFPKFYSSNLTDLNECLIMGNLKTAGYDIIGRENMLDVEHIELIFKVYGKFHALSMAFKDQHPDEYTKLVRPTFDFFSFISRKNVFKAALKRTFEDSFNCASLDTKNACQEYVENSAEVFARGLNYKGKYTCVVHGDCWSNNMMFKYKDSKLEAMKLIDFQFIKDDTPVHDLSYCLYAGGTKETYQNVYKYLKIYHESFSKACRELGSDPEKVFPYEALVEDWKKYSKWGLMMSFIVSKVKLLGQKDIQEMTDGVGFFQVLCESKIDGDNKKMYEERLQGLIEDAYNKGFLLD